MLESLIFYTTRAHKLGREGFLQAYGQPVFVIEPFSARVRNKFQTVSASLGEGTTTSVARVIKREEANAFGMMITLGRAPNNDITIPAPDVSKFHAYMRQDAEGVWTLTDAGSRFGSSVAGVNLEKDAPAQLAPGTKVKLGTSVRMTFHSPATFLDYLLSGAGDE